MPNNTFPPKFNKNILYPAELNLDKIDFSGAQNYNNNTGIVGDNTNLNEYFSIEFPRFGQNIIPTLGFGKHMFVVTVNPPALDSNLPPLKQNSNVLFEVKDAEDSFGNRRVVFSDTTPIYSDGILKFTGYLWIKQDPIRTYESIQDGYGYITLVGIHDTLDTNWNNKYNIRVQLPIIIDTSIEVTHDNGYVSTEFFPNYSPIVFKKPDSMRSGSGLTITEKTIIDDGADNRNVLVITSSNLQTYSGEVESIVLEYWNSSSAVPQWKNLSGGSHNLINTIFEEDINITYAQGINPKIEQWEHEISPDDIPDGDTQKVKFKVTFKNNTTQEFALSTMPLSASLVTDNKISLLFPEGDPETSGYIDTDASWLIMNGAPTYISFGNFEFTLPPNADFLLAQTTRGRFMFGDASLPGGNGTLYDTNGNPSNTTTDDDYTNYEITK